LSIQTIFKRSKLKKCGRIFVLEAVTECHLLRKDIAGHFQEPIATLFNPFICDLGAKNRWLIRFEFQYWRREGLPIPSTMPTIYLFLNVLLSATQLFFAPLHTCVEFFVLQTQQRHGILQSGGNDRAIRRISVISAALSEPPADTKCQFSGLTGASRLPFRRIYCINCNLCSNNYNIYSIRRN
jgi:hypothetical protein